MNDESFDDLMSWSNYSTSNKCNAPIVLDIEEQSVYVGKQVQKKGGYFVDTLFFVLNPIKEED